MSERIDESAKRSRDNERLVGEKLFSVSQGSKATSVEELKADIKKHLDVHFDVSTRGFSLAFMNRRYGMLCKKLGTTIHAVLNQMQADDQVAVYPFERSVIIISTQVRPYFVVGDDVSLEDASVQIEHIERSKMGIFKKSLT